MNRKTPLLLLAILTFSGIAATAAPLGTAFTYQGRLNDGTTPANGSYDMMFAVYNGASSGSLVAGPLTNAVAVSNGLFVVTLDFGAGVFAGEARWHRLPEEGTAGPLSPARLEEGRRLRRQAVRRRNRPPRSGKAYAGHAGGPD